MRNTINTAEKSEIVPLQVIQDVVTAIKISFTLQSILLILQSAIISNDTENTVLSITTDLRSFLDLLILIWEQAPKFWLSDHYLCLICLRNNSSPNSSSSMLSVLHFFIYLT